MKKHYHGAENKVSSVIKNCLKKSNHLFLFFFSLTFQIHDRVDWIKACLDVIVTNVVTSYSKIAGSSIKSVVLK